jgi:hypothetical protein
LGPPDRGKEVTRDGSDVATLAKLIRLPYPPRSVRWQTSGWSTQGDWPGGSDSNLTAVMLFDPAQIHAIIQACPQLARAPQRIWKGFESWFPPSFAARFARTKRIGDSDFSEMEGLLVDPKPFLSPDGPLIHGTATIFEDEGVVYLGLYTM